MARGYSQSRSETPDQRLDSRSQPPIPNANAALIGNGLGSVEKLALELKGSRAYDGNYATMNDKDIEDTAKHVKEVNDKAKSDIDKLLAGGWDEDKIQKAYEIKSTLSKLWQQNATPNPNDHFANEAVNIDRIDITDREVNEYKDMQYEINELLMEEGPQGGGFDEGRRVSSDREDELSNDMSDIERKFVTQLKDLRTRIERITG
jgi:hypothetical protein